MEESKHGWISIVIIALIIWGITSIFSGKKDNEYRSSSYDDSYSDLGYENENPYNNQEYTEPENPYDEGSGHYAGYEWAEENDVSYCDGSSDSFIEGCEEWLTQQEQSGY